MAKKTSKKIDQILAELAELRSEVRALAKAQAPVAKKRAHLSGRKTAAPSRAKPAKTSKTSAGAQPKRPVLVAGSEAPQPPVRSAR